MTDVRMALPQRIYDMEIRIPSPSCSTSTVNHALTYQNRLEQS